MQDLYEDLYEQTVSYFEFQEEFICQKQLF